MADSGELAGQVVAVTGASSWIGAATALACARSPM
jgi:NAD(P)-dependent dehydrogenase (short-subunit alcohol dehydrogenase family)